MANSILPHGYFASTKQIRRWSNWQDFHIDKLEWSKHQEMTFWSHKPQTLTFKGWLQSWVNHEIEVEREQLLWELQCIKKDRMQLDQMIHAHPDDVRHRWNSDLWDDAA